MHIRSLVCAVLATIASGTVVTIGTIGTARTAGAQTIAVASTKAALSEQQLKALKDTLVWNSPWEGRGATPGRLYSYRTIFHSRRDAMVAEVISYATNQRSDSVVDIRNGRLTWQDSNGANVSVAMSDAGELAGTATSKSATVPIVLKPRP